MKSFPHRLLCAVAVVLIGAGCAMPRSRVSACVLMQADREFARAAELHSVANAFREFAAPNAVSLPMGEAPVRGREAIHKSLLDVPAGALSWSPVAGEISRSGDLGYTWGTYQFRVREGDAPTAVRHGKYVTIWKKQPDGSWKYVLDTGNSSPPNN